MNNPAYSMKERTIVFLLEAKMVWIALFQLKLNWVQLWCYYS